MNKFATLHYPSKINSSINVWTNHGLPYLKKDEDHQATIIRRFEDLSSDRKGL